MDLAFSEEQEMLRAEARSFLAESFPPERVAELADSRAGWDPASWATIADLGWTGLSIAETHGGAGMGFLDEAVVFEELGRALYPGPYFSTVALALPALEAGGGELSSEIASGAATATLAWAESSGPHVMTELESLGTKAERADAGWSLTGDKHLVPDLAIVDHVVAAAKCVDGLGLWAVARDDLAATETMSTMDSTRRFGRARLAGTPARLLVGPERAGSVVEATRLRALAALALEAVGIASRALELAVMYAKERKQFDKPIGSYQAVSHPIATTYMETELARSLAYWAAWCVSEEDPQAGIATSAAKAFAAEAAVGACERSIQVHGGIGFTWEHPLHRYYKRAQWIESFEGFGPVHRAAVAAELLDRSSLP